LIHSFKIRSLYTTLIIVVNSVKSLIIVVHSAVTTVFVSFLRVCSRCVDLKLFLSSRIVVTREQAIVLVNHVTDLY
jgi:hypothetical protein